MGLVTLKEVAQLMQTSNGVLKSFWLDINEGAKNLYLE
jgi:hypothetical protein